MNFKYIYVYTCHDNAKTHKNFKTIELVKKNHVFNSFQNKNTKKITPITPVVSKQSISDVRQRCKVVFMFNLGLL